MDKNNKKDSQNLENKPIGASGFQYKVLTNFLDTFPNQDIPTSLKHEVFQIDRLRQNIDSAKEMLKSGKEGKRTFDRKRIKELNEADRKSKRMTKIKKSQTKKTAESIEKEYLEETRLKGLIKEGRLATLQVLGAVIVRDSEGNFQQLRIVINGPNYTKTTSDNDGHTNHAQQTEAQSLPTPSIKKIKLGLGTDPYKIIEKCLVPMHNINDPNNPYHNQNIAPAHYIVTTKGLVIQLAPENAKLLGTQQDSSTEETNSVIIAKLVPKTLLRKATKKIKQTTNKVFKPIKKNPQKEAVEVLKRSIMHGDGISGGGVKDYPVPDSVTLNTYQSTEQLASLEHSLQKAPDHSTQLQSLDEKSDCCGNGDTGQLNGSKKADITTDAASSTTDYYKQDQNTSALPQSFSATCNKATPESSNENNTQFDGQHFLAAPIKHAAGNAGGTSHTCSLEVDKIIFCPALHDSDNPQPTDRKDVSKIDLETETKAATLQSTAEQQNQLNVPKEWPKVSLDTNDEHKVAPTEKSPNTTSADFLSDSITSYNAWQEALNASTGKPLHSSIKRSYKNTPKLHRQSGPQDTITENSPLSSCKSLHKFGANDKATPKKAFSLLSAWKSWRKVSKEKPALKESENIEMSTTPKDKIPNTKASKTHVNNIPQAHGGVGTAPGQDTHTATPASKKSQPLGAIVGLPSTHFNTTEQQNALLAQQTTLQNRSDKSLNVPKEKTLPVLQLLNRTTTSRTINNRSASSKFKITIQHANYVYVTREDTNAFKPATNLVNCKPIDQPTALSEANQTPLNKESRKAIRL